jgi:hypothetical protein
LVLFSYIILGFDLALSSLWVGLDFSFQNLKLLKNMFPFMGAIYFIFDGILGVICVDM